MSRFQSAKDDLNLHIKRIHKRYADAFREEIQPFIDQLARYEALEPAPRLTEGEIALLKEMVVPDEPATWKGVALGPSPLPPEAKGDPPATTWSEDFEWITRHCKCSVEIEVNGHRDVYRSVEEEFSHFKDDSDEAPDDVTLEMVRQDRIVRVQAYPDTPIGHYVVLHHDIGAAVKRMREILESDR